MRDPAVADGPAVAEEAVGVARDETSLVTEAIASATAAAAPPEPGPPAPAYEEARPRAPEPPAQARATHPRTLRTGAPERPSVPPPGPAQAKGGAALELPSHKHSMSWFKRWRIRRKQRRAR
jgi:hypothetical protein